MELEEAVRIVREETLEYLWRPTHHTVGWRAHHVAALETVLAALSRRSEEWAAVVTALGPHAHPGLSPSECVASVVALLADETEMVVGPDGPRAKRSPYLHWRRRAEKAEAALAEAEKIRADHAIKRGIAEAKLAEAQGLLNSSEIRSGQVRLIRERDEARARVEEQNSALTGLALEIGRLRAIISLGDAAAFEEHMAAREAYWVVEVESWKNQAQEIAQSNADHVKWHREAEAALAAEREKGEFWLQKAVENDRGWLAERERSERLKRMAAGLVAEGVRLRDALEQIASGFDPISKYPDGRPYEQDHEDDVAIARAALAPAQPEEPCICDGAPYPHSHAGVARSEEEQP